ncbi:MAG: PD-(D/E)XK nuclease family protein [Gemmatimonadota bacterium]
MMNPFETHGLRTLSPSSLNLFVEDPACWALQYLVGVRGASGSAAWRGNALEFALLHGVRHPDADLAELERVGETQFQYQSAFSLEWATCREREELLQSLPLGLAPLRRHGAITGCQSFVRLTIPDVEVPLVGYADYVFERSVVDLKSCRSLPDGPDPGDLRQVAFYARALEREGWILYVSPEGVLDIPVRGEDAWRDCLAIAGEIRALLAAHAETDALARSLTPRLPDTYYWSEAMRRRGREFWPGVWDQPEAADRV